MKSVDRCVSYILGSYGICASLGYWIRTVLWAWFSAGVDVSTLMEAAFPVVDDSVEWDLILFINQVQTGKNLDWSLHAKLTGDIRVVCGMTSEWRQYI